MRIVNLENAIEISTANFSRCQQYRYLLTRSWDQTLPHVLFIGLNPSTADAKNNDPTLVRCMGFARDWGFGGVRIANLFAYRTTWPTELKRAGEPIGPQNNRWLRREAKAAALVIVAWGNDGKLLLRASQVLPLLPAPHCLAINQSGEPAHPLYQPASTRPSPYTQR
ncbi:MAG: hypothetical protein ACI8PP_003187 [Candidatus Pseudothioglobus sp.]